MTPERAVEWMEEQGQTCYKDMIHDLQCTANEISAEAGRYGHLCPETQRLLQKIKVEITDVQQRALDRYEDWASD